MSFFIIFADYSVLGEGLLRYLVRTAKKREIFEKLSPETIFTMYFFCSNSQKNLCSLDMYVTGLSLWISHFCSSAVMWLLGKFYCNRCTIVLVWQSLSVMCTLVSVSQHVTDCSLQLGLRVESSINLDSEQIISDFPDRWNTPLKGMFYSLMKR